MADYPRGQYMQTSGFRADVAQVKQNAVCERTFTSIGALLLALLSIVPIWDGIAMITSVNYHFWEGSSVAWALILSCIVTFFLFLVSSTSFFGNARPERLTAQSLAMVASLFATLLGTAMIVISVPLNESAAGTFGSLMYQCGTTEQTRPTYEVYQVLLNLRKSPACLAKETVEECEGYVGGFSKEKEYLKRMEQEFRCSGFCSAPPRGASLLDSSGHAVQQLSTIQSAANYTDGRPELSEFRAAEIAIAAFQTAEQPPSKALTPAFNEAIALAHRGQSSADAAAKKAAIDASFDQAVLLAAQEKVSASASRAPPPTLFSKANFDTSCDGAAARDMRNFAVSMATQMWYFGICMISMGIVIGAWEWTRLVVSGP